MPKTFIPTIAGLVLCVGLPQAIAQDSEADDTPDTRTEVTLGNPAPGHDPLGPYEEQDPLEPDETPEGQVDRILGVPSSRVLIDPRVLGVAPGEDLPDLMREGSFIVEQTGRLLPTDDRGYAVIVFESLTDPQTGLDTKPLAMVVAPNRMLESMEALQKRRGDDLRFTLSGQVHTYRGVNYLLLTDQPRPWLLRHEETEDETPEPEIIEAETVETENEEGDAEQVEDVSSDQPLSPEEELEALIRQGQSRGAIGEGQRAPRNERNIEMPPVVPAGVTQRTVLGQSPTASGQRGAELIEEGAFILGRTGRLIRSSDGAHALFVFDADDLDSPEPPMLIQACLLLEEMESTVYEQGDHTPFILTGQVQTYRGANYLLPTSFRLEFDRRNLE